MFLHSLNHVCRFLLGLPITIQTILSIIPRLATSVLLFEFLLEFLLVGVLRIFLHHMGTRTSLNNFLAMNILCSRLLFNIQRANEVGNAKLLPLMFQRSSKICGNFAMIHPITNLSGNIQPKISSKSSNKGSLHLLRRRRTRKRKNASLVASPGIMLGTTRRASGSQKEIYKHG